MSNCDHHHQVLDAAQRRDPTGTYPIVRRFDREAIKRFRQLRTLVRRVVVDFDVLALKGVTTDNMDFAKLHGGSATANLVELGPCPSGEKARAFMAWLRIAANEVVLGAASSHPDATEGWSGPHMQAAYEKGVGDALARLQAAKRPVPPIGALHAHALTLIKMRTHEAVINVVDTTIQQVSRVLAQSLITGTTPDKLSRDLIGRIDAIGINRARLVASFETVSAYSESSLNVYEDGGIKRVGVIPEWVPRARVAVGDALLPDTPRPDYGPGIYKRGENKGFPKSSSKWPKGRWPMVGWATADDDDVCPICQALEDQVFTLETARGMFPAHPNCRCALYPLIEEDDN